jgi:Zn-dependent protease with chaperone function
LFGIGIGSTLSAMLHYLAIAALTVCAVCATDNLHEAHGSAAAGAWARLVRDGLPDPPSPVNAETKLAILATLPAKGEAALSSRAQAKVQTLQSVLAQEGLTPTTEIRIVNLPFACAALHARVVLIISERALRVLASEELQAVAAHELGHELFWDEYYRARERNDLQAMHEVELLADAVAIRTLVRRGKDPKDLISALKKMYRYNATLPLPELDTSTHPALNERARFQQRVIGQLVTRWFPDVRTGEAARQ